MKKKYYLLLKIFLIWFFLTNIACAELKSRLIKKIQDTHTLTFEFKQQIADKVETGNCSIRYSKLIRCDYADSYKKRLISNGKTLAIIQRRYKKIFYYPLKTTPLYFILDKEYLTEFINNNEPVVLNDLLINYEIHINGKKVNLFFDKNSLNVKGWETEDLYKNKVQFLILNLEVNVPVNDNLFIIPTKDKL